MEWYKIDKKHPKKSQNDNDENYRSVAVLCIGPLGACVGYYDYNTQHWIADNEDCNVIMSECTHWTYLNEVPEDYEGYFDKPFYEHKELILSLI